MLGQIRLLGRGKDPGDEPGASRKAGLGRYCAI